MSFLWALLFYCGLAEHFVLLTFETLLPSLACNGQRIKGINMKYINWSININETDFQELFELYWNANLNDKAGVQNYVISELYKYAYFYVITRPNSDFDLASNFFLNIMKEMNKILEAYEPSYDISFLVYFTSKLKRRLLNYYMKEKKKATKENINEFYKQERDIISESIFEPKPAYKDENIDISFIMETCLSRLKQDEETAVKLYYGFPLSFENLRYLIRNSSRQEVFIHYRKYNQFLNEKIHAEKRQREYIFKKLHDVNLKIVENAQEISLKKRDKLLQLLESVRSPAPYRLIADIFQCSLTNVYRKVQRGKVKLENLLSNQLFLDFTAKKNMKHGSLNMPQDETSSAGPESKKAA